MTKGAYQSSLGKEGIGCEVDPSKTPQNLGKFIGYFEKAPDLAQNQANIFPGEKTASSPHNLSLVTCTRPVHSCAPSCPRARGHVGVTGTQPTGDGMGSKGLSFNMKDISFVLAMGKVGLFPWQDKGRWEIGNSGAAFHTNKPFHHNLPCVAWNAFLAVCERA